MDEKIGNYFQMILDGRFVRNDAKIDYTQELCLGAPVMYIGKEDKFFGQHGRIIKHLKEEKEGYLDLRILRRFVGKENDFAKDIIRNFKDCEYFSLHEAAEKANMNKGIFSRVCSSLVIKLPYYLGLGSQMDLAIPIKFGKQGKVVSGYSKGVLKQSRNDPNQYYNDIYFSDKTIDLVKEYRRQFPSFFATIASNFSARTLDVWTFIESRRIEIPFDDYLNVIDNEQYNFLLEQKLIQQGIEKEEKIRKERENKSIDDILDGLQSDLENMTFGTSPKNDSKVKKDSSSDESDDDMDVENVLKPDNDNGKDKDTDKDKDNKDNKNENENENKDSKEEKEKEKEKEKGDDGDGNDGNDANVSRKNAIEAAFEKAREIKLEEIEMKKDLEFRERDEAIEYLQKIKEWVSKQLASQLPFSPISSKTLSPDLIKAIENGGDKYCNEMFEKETKGYKLCSVPVHHIYRCNPPVPWSPTPPGAFELGDRVASLRADEGIPFGTLGTVIGIHKEDIEIVTDKVILNGSNLKYRCSPNRGLQLKYSSVINLSKPQHKLPEKMLENQSNTRDDLDPFEKNNNNNNNNNRRGDFRNNYGSRDNFYNNNNNNNKNYQREHKDNYYKNPRYQNYDKNNNYQRQSRSPYDKNKNKNNNNGDDYNRERGYRQQSGHKQFSNQYNRDRPYRGGGGGNGGGRLSRGGSRGGGNRGGNRGRSSGRGSRYRGGYY